MARVSMWSLRLPCQNATNRVDWVGMTMEWESGGPNLFHLSASVVFAFGGPRDATALMRDLSELGKLSRADLKSVFSASAGTGTPRSTAGQRSVVRTQLPSPTRATPVFDGDTVAPTESPPAPR